MAGFTTSFGARNPNAQGGHGQYGAQTPGTNAGNPASQPSAIPGLQRAKPSAGRMEGVNDPSYQAAQGPPAVQTPSVNRDGTIPPPAAPVQGPASVDTTNDPMNGPWMTDFNGGSPPAIPLRAGMQGWRWDGQRWQQTPEVGIHTRPNGGGGGGGGYAGGGSSFQMQDLGPLADSTWNTFVTQNLAPRALSQENLPTYTGQTQAAFVNPNDPRVANQQNELMLRVLQNPESMSPDIVAGMKEAQKEASLSMLDQLTGGINQGAAGRGLAGSGYAGQQAFNAKDAAVGNITKAYRDIDQMAAATNFADRLAALQMGDTVQSGQMQRGLGAFGADLQRNQFNADERFREHGSQVDRTKFGYQRTVDEANLQNQAVQNALQAWSTQVQENLGRYGVQLDAAGLAENSLMGRLGYGLDLARLSLDAQRNMTDRIPMPRG